MKILLSYKKMRIFALLLSQILSYDICQHSKNEYMKKILTCILAAFGLTTACGQQTFENYDVKEFAELIADSNVVILDVRKADEFAEGHIARAILIDQFQSDFVEQAKDKLPIDKTIAIYCRSGRRSANAAGKLADVGYKCVNLKGGILAWKEANMPVIKKECL